MPPDAFVLTGVMAAGKSTVGELLAGRFEPSVHVRGSQFRRMIVRGQAPITPELGTEALDELELRRRLAVATANEYWAAGYCVVLQDIYVGAALTDVVEHVVGAPLHVVVLTPRVEVVAERERTRAKTGYVDGWDVAGLSEVFLRETPRLGLWLDTSELTAEETVEEILLRREEARVR